MLFHVVSATFTGALPLSPSPSFLKHPTKIRHKHTYLDLQLIVTFCLRVVLGYKFRKSSEPMWFFSCIFFHFCVRLQILALVLWIRAIEFPFKKRSKFLCSIVIKFPFGKTVNHIYSTSNRWEAQLLRTVTIQGPDLIYRKKYYT